MLLSGAVQAEDDGSGPSKDVSIMVSEPSPDASSPPLGSSLQAKDKTSGRRRSFYNFPFLLKHQDAVEHEDENSPTRIRVSITYNLLRIINYLISLQIKKI